MVAFHKLGMPSFDLGGKNSLEDYNLRLTVKPTIPTAQARAEKVYVSGRDSFLTFTDGTYENIVIEVGLRLRVLPEKAGLVFEEVDAWLTGIPFYERELQFSHYEKDKYRWYETKPYSWEYFPATGEFFTKVQFECRPFKKGIEQTIVKPPSNTLYDYDYRGKLAPSVKIVMRVQGTGTVSFQDRTTKKLSRLDIAVPTNYQGANINIFMDERRVTSVNGDSLLKYCKGSFPHFLPNRMYGIGVYGNIVGDVTYYFADKKQ
ncbi:Phage putative tail component [Bacillus cereus]|nr:Phage putative tail component [Bacillus cereus]